jgi:hypothetical protein
MWNAYDALVATWKDFPPAVAKSFTAEESAGIELDRR